MSVGAWNLRVIGNFLGDKKGPTKAMLWFCLDSTDCKQCDSIGHDCVCSHFWCDIICQACQKISYKAPTAYLNSVNWAGNKALTLSIKEGYPMAGHQLKRDRVFISTLQDGPNKSKNYRRTIGGQENNSWIKFYAVWTLFHWIIIIIVIIIQWYRYSVPHKSYTYYKLLIIIIIDSL